MNFPTYCPADYYFFMDKLTADPEALGVPIEWREQTFLYNPRTATAIKVGDCLRPRALIGNL